MADKYTNAGVIPGLTRLANFATGEYCATHGANWDVDEDIEFHLSYDNPRYQRCKTLALELKEQYPLDDLDPTQDYVKICKQEKAITHALMDKIRDEYGGYNEAIANGGNSAEHPSLHDDLKRSETDHPASLSEFSQDELICRQFAPLFAALSTKAGMKTLCHAGQVNFYDIETGKLESEEKPITQAGTGHQFVVSRLTCSVIEATTEGKHAYCKAITSRNIDDVVAGQTILTANSKSISTYGSGYYPAPELTDMVEKRRQLLKQGKVEDLDFLEIDYGDPAEVKKAIADDPEYIQKQYAEYFSYSKQYDDIIADKAFKEYVKPTLDEFKKAIKTGDVATVQDILVHFPIMKSSLSEHLAYCLVHQQHPATIALLCEHDAKAGFNETQDFNILPFVYDHKKESFNPHVTAALIEKFPLDKHEYMREALQQNWPDQVEFALQIVDPKTLTPELIRVLKFKKDKYLNSGSHRKVGEAIEAYLNPNHAFKPFEPVIENQMIALDDPIKPSASSMGTGNLIGAFVGGLTALFFSSSSEEGKHGTGRTILSFLAMIAASIGGWFAGGAIEKTFFGKDNKNPDTNDALTGSDESAATTEGKETSLARLRKAIEGSDLSESELSTKFAFTNTDHMSTDIPSPAYVANVGGSEKTNVAATSAK